MMSENPPQTQSQQYVFIGGLVVAVAATLVLGAVAHKIMKRLGAEAEDDDGMDAEDLAKDASTALH